MIDFYEQLTYLKNIIKQRKKESMRQFQREFFGNAEFGFENDPNNLIHFVFFISSFLGKLKYLQSVSHLKFYQILQNKKIIWNFTF